MHKHLGLLNFLTVPLSLVLLVSSLAGAADFSLQAEMNAVLKTDPRNSGIAVSVQYRANPPALFYDLRAVAPTNSMADVFRVFLQFAQTEKSREFESVELAYRGQPRFMISGKYFKQLGEEFGTQNPVYTIRTFTENLLRPDGSRAYPTWTGGLIGVAGKQIEDFNDFHRQWWLLDFSASATRSAAPAPQLQSVSAASASITGPPASSQSSPIISTPTGEAALPLAAQSNALSTQLSTSALAPTPYNPNLPPLKGTISNLDTEPAAYMPDPSLAYGRGPILTHATVAGVTDVVVPFGLAPVVDQPAVAVGGVGFLPRVVERPRVETHRPAVPVAGHIERTK